MTLQHGLPFQLNLISHRFALVRTTVLWEFINYTGEVEYSLSYTHCDPHPLLLISCWWSLIFGVGSIKDSTIQLSWALNHRTVAIRPRIMIHHSSLHWHNQLRDVYSRVTTHSHPQTPLYLKRFLCGRSMTNHRFITIDLPIDRRTRMILDLLRLRTGMR